jgi:hypothetical protein
LGPRAFREVFYPSSGPGGYLSPTGGGQGLEGGAAAQGRQKGGGGGHTRVEEKGWSAMVVGKEIVGSCWGPSASEGPQKHDLTMFLEYDT